MSKYLLIIGVDVSKSVIDVSYKKDSNNESVYLGRYSNVSQMANKKMKSLLSNCILSTIRYDSEIMRYYNRKKEEGKESGVVLNAIKNKLTESPT